MELRRVIRPGKGWQLIDFRELWRYKDLVYFLTVRGIKAKYAQSVLGISWAIIQPLFTAIIFTIVFGRFARVDTGDVPYLLFSFLALWPWNYFSATLTDSSLSLISNSQIITKVYFPRIALPLSAVFSKLLDFTIAFSVVVVLIIYFQLSPQWTILWLPVLVIQLLSASLGIGLILSAMAVQYRDVKHAITFLVQLLMFAAPVVYSTRTVPDHFKFCYSLNPMVGVIEGFRAAVLGEDLPWAWIWPGAFASVVILICGLLYFRRMERIFADVA